jgi:DeoR/GlpR family transcriptional regulator of sugar metabolism
MATNLRWAAEGKCKRVYGGALPLSPQGGPLKPRLLNDVHEKRTLALAALPLLSVVSTVFLDSGSTNLALAREIPLGRPLTVVTNSISIAAALLERKKSQSYRHWWGDRSGYRSGNRTICHSRSRTVLLRSVFSRCLRGFGVVRTWRISDSGC